MCSEEALEEIEALTAILEEDTVEIVKEGDSISELNVSLTPLTASEQDKQYVSLTLVIRINSEYPSIPPDLRIKNPRGLDDAAVAGLVKQMKTRCEEYIGCPVFFELIELGREFLTERNVPVCQCIICLNNIQEDDVFMKTDCDHFFHKHCLGRYITNCKADYEAEKKELERQSKHTTVKEFCVTCPVCREVILEDRYSLADLISSPPPIACSEETKISIGSDVKRLQQEMKKLFLKQKEKGGIIDLEEEGRKYLVLTGSQGSTEEFTELSPTDFSSDGVVPLVGPSSPHRKLTTPKSVTPQESPQHGYDYHHYNQQRGVGGGGRGRGNRGRGRGCNNRGGGGGGPPIYHQPAADSKGKSHHQQRKGKAKAAEEGRAKNKPAAEEAAAVTGKRGRRGRDHPL